MKVIEKDFFTMIEAEENYILVNKQTREGAFVIYLGKNDSVNNYEEILEVDYVEPSEEDYSFEEIVSMIFDEEVNK